MEFKNLQSISFFTMDTDESFHGHVVLCTDRLTFPEYDIPINIRKIYQNKPFELQSSTSMISFRSLAGVLSMMLQMALLMTDRASSRQISTTLRLGRSSGYFLPTHLGSDRVKKEIRLSEWNHHTKQTLILSFLHQLPL